MLLTLLAIGCVSLAPAAEPAERACVVVVVGAPGTTEYEVQFRRWAGLWQSAAEKAGAEAVTIGVAADDVKKDRDALRETLASRASAGTEPIWLVLIGHGTSDGREAKFNLRGPDVSDTEIVEWLRPLQRPLIVIECASSSGPFLNKLSAPNRIVITATRSGAEQNFARFGQYLAEAVSNTTKADIDKDGQVSLLEAFLTAASRVDEFYKTRSRLATEHALIDDNGDRLGTPPDWFRGVRATRRAKDGSPADGIRAHQIHLIPSDRERSIPVDVRRRRDQLELSVAALRDKKASLDEAEYYRELEALMLELARIYRDLPISSKPGGS